MSTDRLSRFSLLPELELVKFDKDGLKGIRFKVRKTSTFEVCPRCATKCSSVYDHRSVRISDAPIRGASVVLEIRKRRFRCQNCAKVFMEPVSGITKGARYTQRFKREVLWCCEKFSDLKAVKEHTNCSYGFLYSALYEQLELKRRQHTSPWPKTIGIDEHSFKKNKKYGYTEFATMIVDHRNKRAIEVCEGKAVAALRAQTAYLKGRENVSFVTMDLCSSFRKFANEMFPRAKIVADKFHVVRLLDNQINRQRKQITGDTRNNPIRKLLLKNSHKLDYWKRVMIYKWLENHPKLKVIYTFKQALHKLYRIKGYGRAKSAFRKMVDAMGYSPYPEIQTVRKTLIKWQYEILNYFRTGLTNARVEGFNNKAKLIKRKAYGYRSFKNYRLRVLNACC